MDQFIVHLQSCFITSRTVISTNYDFAMWQLDDLHQTHYTSDHVDLWENMDTTFTESTVREAIIGLDERKD